MPREPKPWNRATRVGTGGIHIYVPREIVERALVGANIPAGQQNIKVRVYGLRSDTPGSGRLLIKLAASEDP
jgi:hypothetical protein